MSDVVDQKIDDEIKRLVDCLMQGRSGDDLEELERQLEQLRAQKARQQIVTLEQRLESLNAKLGNLKAEDDYEALVRSHQQTQDALAELRGKKPKAPPSPTSSTAESRAGGVKKRLQNAKNAKNAIPEDHLPTWPEDVRGMPNEMIRSSFVTARKSGPRANLRGVVIATNAGRTMTYWGEELRKKDEDVLLEIYHRARGQPLGTPIVAQPKDFLTSMRWPDSGRSYQELYECLERIQRVSIHFRRDEDGSGKDYEIVQGSLLSKLRIQHYESAGLREIEVTVNPATRDLWTVYHYTLIDFDIRRRLSGSLAPFMHRYYSSHKLPYPVTIAYLHNLCASGTEDLARFKQALGDALQQLVDVGFLRGFFFDSATKVHVVRANDATDELPDSGSEG